MEINYFDLSGGINQSSTKTELGVHTQKLYWTDSTNIEIFQNKGIKRQNGNSLLVSIPNNDGVIGLAEMETGGKYKLVITTASGKLYIYNDESNELTLLNKTLHSSNFQFVPFLNGMIVAGNNDDMFYIKNNSNFDIDSCNLVNKSNESFYPDCVCTYKGRLWCVEGSTLYYSALGTYNDFTTNEDAGYISDFHTDTADIVGMNNYKDYLAIYKKERVYLLSGTNPDDFAIVPFADKGAYAKNTIINVDNCQYFLSNGIFALEQVGELNQIRLGNEISHNICEELDNIDSIRIKNSFALNYTTKSQMWFFFPHPDNLYFNTIWINDYVNKCWYKRVVPQNITTACIFKLQVLTADNTGNIYVEDKGTTFNGETINFMWKSPFLSLGDVHHRKLIDEFYFILDDSSDNKFNFSAYKDYDGQDGDDRELIHSYHYDQMLWADDKSPNSDLYKWAQDNNNIPVWTIGTDVLEKAEICGSCYSVQLCIEGFEQSDNCAILGLQFREIYKDE